ncbi:MAG: hypothetical protein [Sanya atkins-like virus 1]|nr:MAG: hypothetical protein [Sanya atkins-like virus 1]UUW20974.1 MAG: hypothetical protein [Sanya atkins-like virus 1]
MTGAVTGAAVTGLTSPTYTLSADMAPDVNSKQSAVTALGGTQAGVDVSSVSRPFTVLVAKPRVATVLGKPNPVTGLINNVPRNKYRILVRKGLTILAGQPSNIGMHRSEFDLPAGADTADIPGINALVSLSVGFHWANANGIADTLKTNLI